MRKIKSIVAAGLLSASLVACTASHDQSRYAPRTLDTNAIVNSKAPAAEKSEALARAGEELLVANPLAFQYANEVFAVALAQDAKNLRANFYMNIVAPLMKLKGIASRVRPLYEMTEKGRADYALMLEELKLKTTDEVYAFLMAGQPDIKDEASVQALIDDLTASLDRIRRFHRDNKNSTLVIKLPQTMAQGILDENAYSPKECEAKQVAEGVYQYRICTKSELIELRMTKPDHEGVQHYAAGMQAYLIMLNSRDLSGAIRTAQALAGQNATSEQVYNMLAQDARFATLRNAGGLKQILGMGLDALAGVRYLLTAQPEACPDVVEETRELLRDELGNPILDWWSGEYLYDTKRFSRRPGYVFKDGLCVKDTDSKGNRTEATLALIESVLRGGTYKFWAPSLTANQYREYEIKPALVFNQPIRDLKSLHPQFDRCEHNIIRVADTTLGGVFINGDVNQLLKNNDCENYEIVRGNE